MRPLALTWPTNLVFLVLYVWVFLAEFRLVGRAGRSAAARGTQDAGSFRLIVWGNTVVMVVAVALAALVPAAAIVHRLAAYATGMASLLAGGLLRRHCFRMLGEHFTGAVDVRPGQPVIDRGAYRWIRHPSYLAGLLIFAGVGLALENWATVVAALAGALAIYAYRIRVEERALLATLGAPYAAYMRRTRRLVPFVY
ncbi:MAG: isoprenylcysteine carboxylmethyltransferase family protein [Vicinamibacterales bacterium]